MKTVCITNGLSNQAFLCMFPTRWSSWTLIIRHCFSKFRHI